METSIVIQGPTNYCRDLIYSKKREIIWSTWEDEPKENIEFIKSQGVLVIQAGPPKDSGYHNVNMQTLSSIRGIRAASNSMVFKTRGDMKFTDIDSLLDVLEKEYAERMMFLCYQNDHCPNYMVDFFSYGARNQSHIFWNHYDQHATQASPESQLLARYTRLMGIKDTDLTLRNNFHYFLKYLKKDICDIFWLKYPAEENGVKKSLADWQTVPYMKY